MKLTSRTIFVVSFLSSAPFAGLLVILLPTNDLLHKSVDVDQPTSSIEKAGPPGPKASSTRPSLRLTFVPEVLNLDQTPVDLLEQPVLVAAHPDTWAVEINKPVVTVRPNGRSTISSSSDIKSIPNRTRRNRRYSLRERLAEIKPSAEARLIQKFAAARAAWPPAQVAFVAIKDTKVVELHSRSGDSEWAFVHRYRVLAASGNAGPKLRRGDRQVPEGVYRITYLNPNSKYHVSLRVNYPNAFDRRMAARDGRTDLGGDIMIHGRAVSAGCLAVGDEAAEELFVLAAEVGKSNIRLIIAPTDLRQNAIPTSATGPNWVPKLHADVAAAMSEFKAPPSRGLLALLGLQ